MIGDIPYFEINADGFKTSIEDPIKDKEGFYKRLLEFIEFNLESNFQLEILCYLVAPDGEVMEAKLDPQGYQRSLSKSLEYYKKNEQYEICKQISNLINEYELH